MGHLQLTIGIMGFITGILMSFGNPAYRMGRLMFIIGMMFCFVLIKLGFK